MKNTPKGWPRMSSALFYQDAGKAIDWLTRAFGFEVRLKVEGDNGRIEHSELVFGDGLIMVSSENPKSSDGHRVFRSPKSIGGASTQSVMVFVDDVDSHCVRARAAGATIFNEPALHDYGEDHFADKSYGATDPEGHHWWFTQRVRDAKN